MSSGKERAKKRKESAFKERKKLKKLLMPKQESKCFKDSKKEFLAPLVLLRM